MSLTRARYARRQFLGTMALAVAGSALAACGAPAATSTLGAAGSGPATAGLVLPVSFGNVGAELLRNSAAAGNSAEQPVILRASWHVEPGNLLEIHGGGFVAGTLDATVVLAQPLTGQKGKLDPAHAAFQLRVVNVQPNLIQALLPADAPKDVYALWVKTPNGISDPVFVNRAEAFWLSEHTVYPGQSVRLIGRNFIKPALRNGPGTVPNEAARHAVQIQLVDPVTQSSVSVDDIQEVTDYAVEFKIPGSVTVGKSYDIRVTNGAGGDYGWQTGMADVGPFLVAEKPAGNPVGVDAAWTHGIPWDRRFNVKDFGAKADGKTDDTSAIQTALDRASASGGGVVFLPAGTYSISSLTIQSKTVLLGAGRDKTVLHYNGTLTPGDPPVPPGQSFTYGKTINFIQGSGEQIGIANLSVINEVKRPADDTYSKYRRLSGWLMLVNLTANGRGYFVKNVVGRNADGEGIHIAGTGSDIVIEGNDVDVSHAAVFISADGYVQIRNNKLSNVGRPNIIFDYGKPGIIEGNSLHGDTWFTSPRYTMEPSTSAAGMGEGRYADLGSRDLYIANNHADGQFGDYLNDGEGFAFQAQARLAYSKATAADARSLTDASQSFASNALQGAKLIIIGGKGIGQMRTITSNSAQQMNIDEPWQIVPDETSVYTVDKYVNYHHIIVGNDLEAILSSGAVDPFTKHYDCIVVGNVLKNSGGITLWANAFPAAKRADFSYFTYVADNGISGAANPAGLNGPVTIIGPMTGYVDDSLSGTLVYGNEYRRNTLTGVATSAVDLAVGNTYELNYALHSGIEVASFGSPRSYPFAQGVLVEDNTVTHALAGVHLSNTAYDTVLKNNVFSGNGTAVDQNGSVRTIAVADSHVLPAIPYHVAGAFTSQGIQLTWESMHADSYKLERADGFSGAFRTIADGLTHPQYLDTAITPNRIYQYRVTAHNAFGDSLPQTVTVYPQQPTPASIVFTRARLIPPSTYGAYITVGKSLAVGAQVRDQYNQPITGAAITYTSDNPAVAGVDNNGTVNGLSEGKTTITATYRDVSAKLIVVVARLKSVLVVPDQADLKVGERVYLRMTGMFSDGLTEAVGIIPFYISRNPTVSYSSSHANVADVVPDDKFWFPYIAAKETGATTITAIVTVDGITVESNPITVNVRG